MIVHRRPDCRGCASDAQSVTIVNACRRLAGRALVSVFVVQVAFCPARADSSLPRLSAPRAVRLTVTETLLGRVQRVQTLPVAVRVNDEATLVAYSVDVKRNKSFRIAVNGKAGKEYAAFSLLGFLPGGKRLAFAARPVGTNKSVFVVGDVEYGPYEGIVGGTTAFSPDGRRVFYAIFDKDGISAICDGAKQFKCDEIYAPRFSPDSKRWAFIAREGSRFRAVLDGVPDKTYEGIGDEGVTFSPDSKRWAYKAVGRKQPKQKVEVAVIDGVEQKGYNSIHYPVFSPDSKHVAYLARQAKKKGWASVIDGKETWLNYYYVERPMYMADNRLAFVVHRTKHDSRIAIDGVGGKTGSDLYMSPSQQLDPTKMHVAFLGGRGYGDVKKLFYVIDDKPGVLFDWAPRAKLTFSPDGRRHAYPALRGKVWTMVIDGKVHPGGERAFPPVFSPDSAHIAYHVIRDKKSIIIRDGIAGKPYVVVYTASVAFSPKGRHLVYLARAHKERKDENHIVVDGVETSQRYIGMLMGARFVFDGPDSFHTIFLKKGQFLRVDVKIHDEGSVPARRTEPKVTSDPRTEKRCTVLLSMAKNYVRVGMEDKAKTCLKEVIEKYPKTKWCTEARAILAELEKRN